MLFKLICYSHDHISIIITRIIIEHETVEQTKRIKVSDDVVIQSEDCIELHSTNVLHWNGALHCTLKRKKKQILLLLRFHTKQ